MGGGDLNLKKSWHPQTLRNVEKVWKAEQKAEAETRKIEQLQRELNEEREREEMQKYAIDQGITKKKSDRLEWMYSAPGHSGINHEDYLLGKSIDKAVDPLAVNDEQDAEAPGASFMEDVPNASTDMAAKIRDDPLFMIKKKENEKKKELLKNPVRMKQLQEMLKADLKTGKKPKKGKKKRKKEKRRKYSSDENKGNTSRNGRKVDSESASAEDCYEKPHNRSSDSRTSRNKVSQKDMEDRRDGKRRSSISPRRDEQNNKYDRQNIENYNLNRSIPKRDSQRHDEDNERERPRVQNSSDYYRRQNSRSLSRSASRSPIRERKDIRVKNNSNERQYYGPRTKTTRSLSRSVSRSPIRERKDIRIKNNSNERRQHGSRRQNTRSSSRSASRSPIRERKDIRINNNSNERRQHGSRRQNTRSLSRSASRSPKRERKDIRIKNNSNERRQHGLCRQNTRSLSRSPKRERKDIRIKNNSNEKNQHHQTARSSSSSSSSSREREQKDKEISRNDQSSDKNNCGTERGNQDRHPSPRERSRSPLTQRNRNRENGQESSTRNRNNKKGPGGSRKMTEEERERKLAEMMDNAKWRDEQRGKNVQRYREEDEQEEKEMAKHDEKGATFVGPMKVETFTSSTASVENRIKRNIHSLQRTPAAMEKFLKK